MSVLSSRLGAAASPSTTDPRVAQAAHVLRIVGYVVAGYFALLVAGLAVLLVFCAAILVIMRLNGPDSPFSRRMTSRLIARTARGSTHRSGTRGDPDTIAAGMDAIRMRDPLFDEQVVLEAARRALFFAFVAGLEGSDERLRQVSTERFWTSPAGQDVHERVARQAATSASMRGFEHTPEAAALKGMLPMALDYATGEIELWSVTPDVDHADHVVVRLAYRGEAALAGPGASLRAQAMSGRFNMGAARQMQAQAGTEHAAPKIDSARIGTQGWYDLEFTRPTGVRSSPLDGAAGRRCERCGAPYRSALDVRCRNCRTDRPSLDGGWKLDWSWLVVDTEARAGEGLNRERHDASWALRGMGRIALRA